MTIQLGVHRALQHVMYAAKNHRSCLQEINKLVVTASQTANIDTESNFMLEVRKHSSTATHARTYTLA